MGIYLGTLLEFYRAVYIYRVAADQCDVAKLALKGESVQATPPMELIVRPRVLSLFALSRSVKGIEGFSPCSATVHT